MAVTLLVLTHSTETCVRHIQAREPIHGPMAVVVVPGRNSRESGNWEERELKRCIMWQSVTQGDRLISADRKYEYGAANQQSIATVRYFTGAVIFFCTRMVTLTMA